MEPDSGGAAGPERSLKSAVKLFKEAVGLRVVGSGGLMINVEARAERRAEVN